MDETFMPGALVTVATGGPLIDAIVVTRPSPQKAMVAMVDAVKGPVLRAVAVTALAERENEGAQDKVLHNLIRRSGHGLGAGPHDGAGAVRGSRGHARTSMHRRAGK